MTQQATFQEAIQAASLFIKQPSVLMVELFGSVARIGKGKDIDLILVSNESYPIFRERLKQRKALHLKSAKWGLSEEYGLDVLNMNELRREIIWDVLGLPDSSNLKQELLDLFIFPFQWRQKIPQLIEEMDSETLRTIANDAIILAAKTL